MVTGDGPCGFVPPTLIPSRVGHPRWCPVVGSPSVNSGRQRTVSSHWKSLEVAMDRRWVRIGHLDLVSGWPWLRCYPPVPLFCGLISMYTSLSLHFIPSSYSTPSCTYVILWTEKRSVPVFDQYPFGWTHQCYDWTLFRLITWTGQSWDPSLRPREWGRWYPSAVMVGYIGLPP